MNKPRPESYRRKRGIRIEQPAQPAADPRENEKVCKELRKYKELIPLAPEPNMGRLREIKEDIRRGFYNSPEVLEETAARLTIRFLTRE